MKEEEGRWFYSLGCQLTGQRWPRRADSVSPSHPSPPIPAPEAGSSEGAFPAA